LTRRKIKVLRLDNGGEYTSKEFINFCIEAGIKRELTVSYNPQQNGVAERNNRTIIEVKKEMIHDQSLLMNLWVEACMNIVYLQNHSPHQILKKITLEEAFTKVKPEIGHFRIFGCPVCWTHLPHIEGGVNECGALFPKNSILHKTHQLAFNIYSLPIAFIYNQLDVVTY
jgi:hypothetical protein